MPAISTFRVDKSMKNTTINRCSPRRVHTSTVKKSAATISSQCRLRNSFHVVFPSPLGRRLDSVPIQNLRDGAAGKLVSQIGYRALDAPVAPVPVLFCHTHHQSFNLSGGTRSPRCPMCHSIVFLGDQFPVPGQQGLRRDNAGDLSQNLPSQCFGSNSQSAALVVIEAHSPVAELLSKNTILLAKIINDLQLALVHPAGDRDQQESEWVKDCRGPQSPLSRARGYSREPSQIHADPVFGPYAVAKTIMSIVRRISARSVFFERHW